MGSSSEIARGKNVGALADMGIEKRSSGEIQLYSNLPHWTRIRFKWESASKRAMPTGVARLVPETLKSV